ncbi:vWA domain-containing protein [Fontivita pretiosa]|uniref:vWA domain-containing protein n=1 Tax=Fontivita pretiosa TaxID=2989684 RepID=UPI003D17724D
MKQPQIEVIPVRAAVRSDAPTTLDVMLRITPPVPETQVQRPALNLGLVLDRSGSMGGENKIGFAREAAIYTVQQLLPTDRVSVTIFDNVVETIVPSTLGENKARIVDLIQGVEPRGSTALHGGWQAGARQVRQHLLAAGLNRVILLSDGLANVGETNPDTIASHVSRLAREGVSTTTMGVGNDYNEDLMEAMARSGDGNYYYIESPQQLAVIFENELKGLMATFGNTVSLGVEPQEGVVVADVLNDLDRLPTGRLKLPNLVGGVPIIVVVRLYVPPARRERELCYFRLAWNAPKQRQRRKMWVSLVLPPVDGTAWESLAPATEVQQRAALLLIARCKKQATSCLERGDVAGTVGALEQAKQLLASVPDSPEMQQEARALARIEQYLTWGDSISFLKHSKYQAHQRRRSERYSEF